MANHGQHRRHRNRFDAHEPGRREDLTRPRSFRDDTEGITSSISLSLGTNQPHGGAAPSSTWPSITGAHQA
jgi:hypothetical protein